MSIRTDLCDGLKQQWWLAWVLFIMTFVVFLYKDVHGVKLEREQVELTLKWIEFKNHCSILGPYSSWEGRTDVEKQWCGIRERELELDTNQYYETGKLKETEK